MQNVVKETGKTVKDYLLPIFLVSPNWSKLDKPPAQLESIRNPRSEVPQNLVSKIVARVEQQRKKKSPAVPSFPDQPTCLPLKVVSSATLVDTWSLFSDIASSKIIQDKLQCIDKLNAHIDATESKTASDDISHVDVRKFLDLESGQNVLKKTLSSLFEKLKLNAKKQGLNQTVVSTAGVALQEMIFDDTDMLAKWDNLTKAAAVEHVFVHQGSRRVAKYITEYRRKVSSVNILNGRPNAFYDNFKIAWILQNIRDRLVEKSQDKESYIKTKTGVFNAWAKSSVITDHTNENSFETNLHALLDAQPLPKNIHPLYYTGKAPDPKTYIARCTESFDGDEPQKMADAKPAYYRDLISLPPLNAHWKTDNKELKQRFSANAMDLMHYKDQDILASIRTQLKGTRKHYRRERLLITYIFLKSYIQHLDKICRAATHKFTIVMHHRTGLSDALVRCVTMVNAQLNGLLKVLFKSKASKKASSPQVQLVFTHDQMLEAKRKQTVVQMPEVTEQSIASTSSESDSPEDGSRPAVQSPNLASTPPLSAADPTKLISSDGAQPELYLASRRQ